MRALKLTPLQWKHLASIFSNIGQAIVLFSAAAFFVPEAFGLTKNFSKTTAFVFFAGGLITLVMSVIMIKKEK